MNSCVQTKATSNADNGFLVFYRCHSLPDHNIGYFTARLKYVAPKPERGAKVGPHISC